MDVTCPDWVPAGPGYVELSLLPGRGVGLVRTVQLLLRVAIDPLGHVGLGDPLLVRNVRDVDRWTLLACGLLLVVFVLTHAVRYPTAANS